MLAVLIIIVGIKSSFNLLILKFIQMSRFFDLWLGNIVVMLIQVFVLTNFTIL